jgi:hypothetical protein
LRFAFKRLSLLSFTYETIMNSIKDMSTIKDVIPSVIGELAKKRPQEVDITTLWQRISGNVSGSRASEIKAGTLTVVVDSSVRKMHLFRKKEELLEQLQNKIPTIKNIYFKVGSV